MSITITILTLNEEENVDRALASVKWCDDVIVVDSYSHDKTENICKSYSNVRFYQNKFVNLAEQRQYALEQLNPKYDWVFGLDADEVVPKELAEELRNIADKYVDGDPIAYDVALRIIMWGKWLRFSSEYPRYWRRFLHRSHCRYEQRGHADTVEANGLVGRLKNDLLHDDRKGLTDWIHRHNRYSSQEAEYAIADLMKVSCTNLFSTDPLNRRRAHKKLFRSLYGNSYMRFIYLYFLRLGFLDGWRGYAFCRLRAHQHFIIRLKQIELIEKNRQFKRLSENAEVRSGRQRC
jgi:glycosyltransferase involved in cell wall biosynthesis